ncbi:MAG: Ig-like domain-containing protein, partial [Acidobacteriota bacterium]
VQLVNVQIGIYDKTGQMLSGFPKPINSIWSGFGGACETHNDGDPIVRYDRQAQRWIISQLTADFNLLNFHECLAVSTTQDPAGSYYRYDVDFGARLQDYPKFAVWPDGWYMSANSFMFGFLLEGGNMCAWERSKLLVGDRTAKVICVVTGSPNFAGLLPADWDGNNPPPTGSPNYFIELYTQSTLAMFKMKPNYQNPGATTMTGPIYINVAPFNLPCGSGGDCIPQKDSTQLLASLGDRLMYRLAYRNFGSHEALVTNHAVAASNTVGVRWYEIRNPGGTPIVYQQGTYVPDSDYRWMASMAMDRVGNIAVGYSKSGPGLYPGIFITGRETADVLGTLRAEQMILAGSGSQQPTLNRWGDYSSIETDPVDDCTFWYTSQYLPAHGTFNWHTRIASFKFDGCGAADTTTTITSDLPEPSVVGQPYVVSFSVAPASGSGTPTGTVSVSDGSGVSCSAPAPTGSCSLTSTTAGARTLTAAYSGDGNFKPSSDVEPHTVNKASTTTSITSDSPDPSSVGQSYTISFTVTVNAPGAGTPTGIVTVSDGATSCSASVVAGSCSLASTTAGTKTLTATYSGESNFNASSGTAQHTVNQTPPNPPTNLQANKVYQTTGKKQVLQRIDLTWQDNSNNEDRFVIERWKLSGGKGRQTCGLEITFNVGANVTQYPDTSATTATCKYRVAAENTAGRSAWAETSVNP